MNIETSVASYTVNADTSFPVTERMAVRDKLVVEGEMTVSGDGVLVVV